MKHAIISVVMVLVLICVPTAAITAISSNNSAEAAPVVHCSDIKIGQTIHIKCSAAGLIVLDETLPLPVVTVKVPLPGQTITVGVPGPTKTVHGPTQTVTLPGSNTTVTSTVTIPPSTQTVTPSVPTQTITTTVTPIPTPGQGATTGGTITPPPDKHPDVSIPQVNLSTPQAVGIGTALFALLTALIVLAMYFGYYMGYKDSDKAERKFYRALLGSKKIRK